MPVKKEIKIKGLPVTYYESGSGFPIILLHGWPQTSYIWRNVFPALEKNYRVLSIELPGLGNDNYLPKPDTLAVATLIKSFCNELKLNKVQMIAHDIGAWVAVTFALYFEELLKSLVVLDAGIPGLIPDEIFSPLNAKKIWQFYFHAIDQMPEFLIAGREQEYLNWYFKNKTAVAGAITDEDIKLYLEAYTGINRLKYGFDYYRNFTESAAQNVNAPRKLNIPILAIGAQYGQGLNMGIAMQKVATGTVRSESISDCGHYITEEQPERFLELVIPFLRGIDQF